MNNLLLIISLIFSLFIPLSYQQCTDCTHLVCPCPYPIEQCVVSSHSPEYVVNGGFEDYHTGWTTLHEQGDGAFVIGNGYLGCDTAVAIIDAVTYETPRGFQQKIVLNQSTPASIVASAWSYGTGIVGSNAYEYSLYLDLTYQDGSNEWGLYSPFPVSPTGWVQRTVQFTPTKPILSLYLNLLFRDHLGLVFFDEVSLTSGVSLCPAPLQSCQDDSACYDPAYYTCSEDDTLLQGGTVTPLFCNTVDINPCHVDFTCCGGLCINPAIESCGITATTTTTIPASSTAYETVNNFYVGPVCCWCVSSIEGSVSFTAPAIDDCKISFAASSFGWPTDGLECRVWSTFSPSSGLSCGYPVAP